MRRNKIIGPILSVIAIGLVLYFLPFAVANEQRAFEIMRDQSSVATSHVQTTNLFSPHALFKAQLQISPDGMSLFKNIYNANEQSGTETELTQRTEEQLANHVGTSFFQRQDLELTIPLPAIKIGRYTLLPDLFIQQEKTSRIHVISIQSIHTTLLKSQSLGLDLLFKLSPFQSWYLSFYQRQQKHRANIFSSNYVSGRKTLFTFEDAVDEETSWNIDIGQRWYLSWINLEWRLQQLMISSDVAATPLSDHRPGRKPLLDLKIFRQYESSVGHWHPSIQLLSREHAELIDGLKLQMDFIPSRWSNSQLTIRRGNVDTQIAITQWWQRPSHAHSLQYQVRHFSAKLENSKVETHHQLHWTIHF